MSWARVLKIIAQKTGKTVCRRCTFGMFLHKLTTCITGNTFAKLHLIVLQGSPKD